MSMVANSGVRQPESSRKKTITWLRRAISRFAAAWPRVSAWLGGKGSRGTPLSGCIGIEGGFGGHFACWSEAAAQSAGIDADTILEKTALAMRKVRDGAVAYARDSVVFERIEYSWPVLAGLLWIASRSGNSLNLIDFGGALGTSYYQSRYFLAHLSSLKWHIVEQPHVVELGNREFANDHMRFYSELDACLREGGSNAMLVSSVLQYLPDPYRFLSQATSSGLEYLVFDRTAFVDRNEDRIAVQEVSPRIFSVSYPCWFLSLPKFRRVLQRNYDLVAEFDGFETACIPDSVFKGFIFVKKA